MSAHGVSVNLKKLCQHQLFGAWLDVALYILVGNFSVTEAATLRVPYKDWHQENKNSKEIQKDGLEEKLHPEAFIPSTIIVTEMARPAAAETGDLQALLGILVKAIPDVVDTQSDSYDKSRLEAIRACEKMYARLHDPFEWLFVESASYVFPAAISVILELKVPRHVSLDRTCPTSIDQLAVATGASAELLGNCARWQLLRSNIRHTEKY
jgi:hypothetical protein